MRSRLNIHLLISALILSATSQVLGDAPPITDDEAPPRKLARSKGTANSAPASTPSSAKPVTPPKSTGSSNSSPAEIQQAMKGLAAAMKENKGKDLKSSKEFQQAFKAVQSLKYEDTTLGNVMGRNPDSYKYPPAKDGLVRLDLFHPPTKDTVMILKIANQIANKSFGFISLDNMDFPGITDAAYFLALERPLELADKRYKDTSYMRLPKELPGPSGCVRIFMLPDIKSSEVPYIMMGRSPLTTFHNGGSKLFDISLYATTGSAEDLPEEMKIEAIRKAHLANDAEYAKVPKDYTSFMFDPIGNSLYYASGQRYKNFCKGSVGRPMSFEMCRYHSPAGIGHKIFFYLDEQECKFPVDAPLDRNGDLTLSIQGKAKNLMISVRKNAKFVTRINPTIPVVPYSKSDPDNYRKSFMKQDNTQLRR